MFLSMNQREIKKDWRIMDKQAFLHEKPITKIEWHYDIISLPAVGCFSADLIGCRCHIYRRVH